MAKSAFNRKSVMKYLGTLSLRGKLRATKYYLGKAVGRLKNSLQKTMRKLLSAISLKGSRGRSMSMYS